MNDHLPPVSAEDLYEQAPCGYLSTQPDGTLIRVNQTLLNWTGYARSALLSGRRFQDLLTVPGQIFYETHYAPLLQMQGFVKEIAFDLVCASQVRLPVLLNATQQQDAAGQPVQTHVSLFDATERRQYERELLLARRKAEQLAAVVHYASDAIISVDPDEVVQTWNAAAERLFGYAAAAALGRPLRDLIIPPDQVTAHQRMMGELWSGRAVAVETVCVRQDGQRLVVALTLTPQVEGRGQLVAISLIVRDITARQQAEATLRASEEKFAKAFNASPLVITITQLADGRLVEVNDSFVQLTGYARAEVLGRTPIEVGLWVDPTQRTEGLGQLQVGQAQRNRELCFRMKDGTQRTGLVSAELIALNGQPCVLTVLNDITERKRAEIARAHLAAIVASSDDAIISKNLQGIILSWNQGAEKIFGYTAAETVGQPITLLIPPQHINEEPYILESIKRGETIAHYETVRRRKDGMEIAISLTVSPIRDEAGHIIGASKIARDITARRQAEARQEQLVQDLAAERAQLQALTATLEQQVQERTAELTQRLHELDEFAYVTSHDLKAPLRAIDHLAHWISEDAADLLPSQSREHLAKLRGRITRMERLLEDLLAYSRAGRYPYSMEQVDVAQLVENILQLVTPPQGFAVSHQTPLPVVRTQKVPLDTVLRNLISNAIKHHDRSDGRVDVAVQDLGEWLAFSVRDDGPGIAPEFHERIFQIFQTLKPRDQVEGSGMGLAIVKKLVEARGGTITVESRVGQGATFRFTWPKE